MLKKSLSAVLCAATVLSATTPACADALPAYSFVHVSGSAFQGMMPDIGALDFEIVATDADPAAARAVLDARLGEVRALMQTLSIDPDDEQMREVRQSVKTEGQAAGAAPVYELRCEIHINVRNLGNWPALAGGLLGKPNLDGFASSFDISTAEQVDDQLVSAAIADARRRAAVIAAADGRRVGAMMAVTPGELKNLSTAMGLERGEFRSPRNSNVRPRPMDRDTLLTVQALKLSQPVDVIFRLENAGPGAKRPK
jgi:uncharacterized protein YggE